MKKLTFNSTLNHKACSYEPMQIVVEKVIPLYGKRFEQLKTHFLDDVPEIIDNKDLMYSKKEEVFPTSAHLSRPFDVPEP